MSVQVSLDNNISREIQKHNQEIQLGYLGKRLETLSDKERFLGDTLYTKLYVDVNDDFESVTEDEKINQLLIDNPMYSIQTVSSYDSDVLKIFVSKLHKGTFTGHVSVKLNGWHIRIVYLYGEFYKAFTKSGRDLTTQITPTLENANLLIIEDFENIEFVEVRGELVLSKDNLDAIEDVASHELSDYTGIGFICNTTNEMYYALLDFIGYSIIAEGVKFSTKTEEYQYLEELGFETPMYWLIEDLQKDTFIEDLEGIVTDCEEEVRATDIQEGYPYSTDGLIFILDDTNYFNKMGKSLSQFQYGVINLRIGYWQQQTYSGYIQTIYWQQEENQLRPYAIIGEKPNIIEFDDFGYNPYILHLNSITNQEQLGVPTENGKVLKVPLYNPNQILRLDAYVQTKLMFVNDKILGVLPCFEDGRVLMDGIVQQVQSGEITFELQEE